jgi:hypothetical protein
MQVAETMGSTELFEKLRDGLLAIDPVAYCERYLTLDGVPFQLNGNGYRPFADIYRYIGMKALEKSAKPVVFVKGRQVGATTMAAALELFFMTSGVFGTAGRPPMRVMHAFPLLDLAYTYAKTKLNTMISNAVLDKDTKKGMKPKTYIESKLDKSQSANDSLQFKQFLYGNHILVESTGLTGDRVRGRTIDCILFDECFPYEQFIETISGKEKIGKIYEMWEQNQELPLIKTFNEQTETFEYKKIIKAWKRDKRQLIQLKCGHHNIKCTPNHKFLTNDGWREARELKLGDLLKTSINFSYSFMAVDKIDFVENPEYVYDIEVEDNHNFIATDDSQNLGGPIVHNCQDIAGTAMANTIKTLAKAQYGPSGSGIQVYFGTPKQKGSDFWNIWRVSSQQYYYLGCENCEKYFPLYTPESNDWENIWIEDNVAPGYIDPKTGLAPHGFIVKCTHCGHEQDKRPAAERGKWVSSKPEEECNFIGYHLNQLYMPNFSRERVMAEKPEFNPINTERAYQNEVLGEFFAGDASPITPEQIREICADEGRSFRQNISMGEGRKVFLGADWGQKVDVDQLVVGDRERRQRGQSYSAVVVLAEDGPGILTIEYAKLLKRNDLEYKKAFIDETFRRYSVTMGVGDIGFANDLTEQLQQDYGDRFLASRAVPAIKHHAKFVTDIFPKEIAFERNYYIAELYDLMKKGMIRFPYGSYEQIGWLVQHCCSMEIQPKMSRTGNVEINYIKGSTPNDGFCALLNAYICWKFSITDCFSITNPSHMRTDPKKRNPIMAVTGYIPRMNPLKR